VGIGGVRLPRTVAANLLIWDLKTNKTLANIEGAKLRSWQAATFSKDRKNLAILGYSAGKNPVPARILDLTGILPPAARTRR